MLWAGILSGDIFPPSPGTGTPLSGTAAKRGSSGRDCATIFPSTAPQSSGRVSAIMRTANAAPTKPNVRHTAILWRGCTTRGATATTSSTGRTITRKPNGSSRWKCRCAFWQRCASKIYLKDRYDQTCPLDYFQRSTSKKRGMLHPETERQLTELLTILAEQGEDAAFAKLRQMVKNDKR